MPELQYSISRLATDLGEKPANNSWLIYSEGPLGVPVHFQLTTGAFVRELWLTVHASIRLKALFDGLPRREKSWTVRTCWFRQ